MMRRDDRRALRGMRREDWDARRKMRGVRFGAGDSRRAILRLRFDAKLAAGRLIHAMRAT
jgi:hypothetical protein